MPSKRPEPAVDYLDEIREFIASWKPIRDVLTTAIRDGLEWRERGKNLSFDNENDPDNAKERTSRHESERAKMETNLAFINTYPSSVEFVQKHAHEVIAAAHDFGIDPQRLALFVAEPSIETWKDARAIVETVFNLKKAEEVKGEPKAAGGQKDKKADKEKKHRIRGPKNIGILMALKQALEKGVRQEQSMRESAVEFFDGDANKADAMLRALRRHKNHPGLN